MSITTPEDHASSEFRYTFRSGKSLALPRLSKVMTFGRTRKMRKLPEEEQVFALLEDICDEDALAVLDEMDSDETEAFFKAWQAHSGASLGESSGSST